MPRADRTEQGFTLIEVLVALAVFSIAALTLVNLAGENTRTASDTEARVIAGFVADNKVSESIIGWPALGVTSGQERAGDRDWRWTRRVSATSVAELVRIDVRVTDARGGRTLAEVVAFRGRR
jgi:general secretion pathway protein I